MKVDRKFWGVGSILLSTFLVACGDDTGGSGGAGGQSGSGGNASASETVTDAASTSDAASTASSTAAASSSSSGGGFVCDTEGFVADSDFAVQDAEAGFGAYSGGVYPGDGSYSSLDIEWYDNRMVVGDDTIIAANYNTCTLCVLLFINCAGEPTVCEKTFLASAGSVELESVTDDLVGTLRDVEMVQVTIDEDLFSDPVPGGETYCIDEYSFDVPIDPFEG